MNAALINKEFRQHWLAFLLMALLVGFGFFTLILFMVVQDEAGSIIDGLGMFLSSFYVISAMVLCNRLVVAEYQSKTQLFLEGLPISRLRMVTIKYLFGLLVMMSEVTIAFALVLLLSASSKVFTARFVVMLATRAYLFAWCAYSGFFMMGLLGRYRIAVYLFLLCGVAALETLTKFELTRFGPVALLNRQFAYERFAWPTEAILVTSGLTVAFVTLTGLLCLVREGSVATLLAEKMSHREKVLIAVLLLGFVACVGVFDARAEKEPFDLPDALTAEVGQATVKVLCEKQQAEPGGRLAEDLAADLNGLAEFLKIDDLPPTFVLQRRDLDAERFERGVLDGAEGLLVRANFLSGSWNPARFKCWLVRELLMLKSHERLKYEPNMWVLDGFAVYWHCPNEDTAAAEFALQELRAAYGAERGFSADDVSNWLSFRERVGADVAASVAWLGLICLQDLQGKEACQAFLRAMLDCDVPADLRAVFHEWRNPIDQQMRRETDLSYEDFVVTWIKKLEAISERRANELAPIPVLNGTIQFEAVSESSRVVNFQFASDPPLQAKQRFALLHAELPPFDDEVPDSELRRNEFQYAQAHHGELPGSFTRGTRIFATFAIWSEQLGCEIISGWTRQEMR